jgi:serine/threonine protein kinase
MTMSAGGMHDPLIGRRLAGRYVVARQLARGGMARVYRAHDERLERPVAVKVLSSPYAEDRDYVRRFLDEARTAASLSHPNLAHVYDSGSDGGVHFIVLELLEGHRSLRDEIARRGRLPVDEAVAVAHEVLAGLAPLHARGLVHCDVKPGNVMIGRGGTKLIDFGIARPLREPTAGATSVGSLHSMSPEQLRGERLTPASDMFAVGVVLFEALTGRVPFPGDSPAEVVAAHSEGPVARPGELADGVPERLEDAILQALDLDPGSRFASASAMDAALQAATSAVEPAAGAGADEDTTTELPVPAWTPEPIPEATHEGSRAPGRQASAPPPSTKSQRRAGRPSVPALIALVAAPALTVAIVLLGLADPDHAGAPGPTPTARTTPSLEPGTVRVPDTIGMSEADAEAAARAAGLNWRIEWQVDSRQRAGIYDQEPAAGTVVQAGARFVMYAYRSS